MPIYEYECHDCHRIFEAWQKVSDAPVGKCEHCGSAKVSKLISQSAFHLKGSGWYLTDYARKGKDTAAKTESASKNSDSGGACGASSGGCGKPECAA